MMPSHALLPVKGTQMCCVNPNVLYTEVCVPGILYSIATLTFNLYVVAVAKNTVGIV